MTTGEKIAEERKKLGLTQQQFADRLNVTRQAVSRWESDYAFPETDSLIAMSGLFGCSIDYLIKYNGAKSEENERSQEDGGTGEGAAQTEGAAQDGGASFRSCFHFSGGLPYFEYKSKATLFGMPLLHINIGLGRVAKGFFSIGLVSAGIISVGLVSLGVLAFGIIALGLAALGSAAGGALAAFGGVAIAGLFAFGGVAVGCVAFGGCSVGLFAFGGYANGSYVAVGGYAVGGITFGESHSSGKVISVFKETFDNQRDEAFALMDDIPSFWRPVVNSFKRLIQVAMKSK